MHRLAAYCPYDILVQGVEAILEEVTLGLRPEGSVQLVRKDGGEGRRSG